VLGVDGNDHGFMIDEEPVLAGREYEVVVSVDVWKYG